MSTAQSDAIARRKPLRLWPGLVAVALQWLLRFALPAIAPETMFVGVIAGLAGGLVVMVWWAFFSRAPRLERWGGIAVMIAALAATPLVLHKSIATGMMGMMFYLYALPVLSLAFVVWAVATRGLSDVARRALMVATIILACGVWSLFRTEGITGEGSAELAWRWTASHEDRLLAKARVEPAPVPAAPAATENSREQPVTKARVEPPALKPAAPVAQPGADWPGFRGPRRDSIIRDVRIETNWPASPPVELWRRPIGPGWSSFAVQGDLFYTQEQRGEDEVVACYKLSTGEPVWTHRDTARFWESNAGAGPRATPTVTGGRVYTFGATGIVNALDATDGSVLWTRNAASDTGTKIPGWGFASSPLVVDGLVIIAASGKLAAYDVNTGAPRWLGPARGGGYSSPHLVTIDGVPQVLLVTGGGVFSVAPEDGRQLWEHQWPSGSAIVQPALISDGDLLISTIESAGALGTRRIAVTRGSGGWTVEERWTSPGLKPYFNDIVVHEGHAFGFDGFILACIDLKDGKRKWKGGRYGHGQMVLLPAQDLLLVLSEEGELALVSADSGKFTEVARFPAIEGKTWNHPVLAGGVLLARNGQEMAAFRLPLARR